MEVLGLGISSNRRVCFGGWTTACTSRSWVSLRCGTSPFRLYNKAVVVIIGVGDKVSTRLIEKDGRVGNIDDMREL
jgi:hypothetical protein